MRHTCNEFKRHRPADGRRIGATLVEMAVILPVLMTLILGALEIGRGIMVKHILEEAARSACRVAALGNGLTSEAEATVDQKMSEAGISGYTTTVTSASIGGGAKLQVMTVTVSVPHSRVAWFSSPRFMVGNSLNGECMMFAESNVLNDDDDDD